MTPIEAVFARALARALDDMAGVPRLQGCTIQKWCCLPGGHPTACAATPEEARAAEQRLALEPDEACDICGRVGDEHDVETHDDQKNAEADDYAYDHSPHKDGGTR